MELNNKIIIGICSDELYHKLHGNYPINNQKDRINILHSFIYR